MIDNDLKDGDSINLQGRDCKIHKCGKCGLYVLEDHSVMYGIPGKPHPDWYCFRCFFGYYYPEILARDKWYKERGKKDEHDVKKILNDTKKEGR